MARPIVFTWLKKYPEIDHTVTDALQQHREVDEGAGDEAKVLSTLLEASTQTDFQHTTWKNVLHFLGILPDRTMVAVLQHALPLLSLDICRSITFFVQGEGVMAGKVPVNHSGNLMGRWEQLCRWVHGKKQGWCVETLIRARSVDSLLAFMTDDTCEEFCLYQRGGSIVGVAEYNNGTLFEYNGMPGDMYACKSEGNNGIVHSGVFYLDSEGVHRLNDDGLLDLHARDAMQGEGLRGRRAAK